MNVDYISIYNLVNAGHSVISTLCNGRGTEVFVNALQTNQPLIWHLRRLLLHASGMKVEGGGPGEARLRSEWSFGKRFIGLQLSLSFDEICLCLAECCLPLPDPLVGPPCA
jgi:hypothetical protein